MLSTVNVGSVGCAPTVCAGLSGGFNRSIDSSTLDSLYTEYILRTVRTAHVLMSFRRSSNSREHIVYAVVDVKNAEPQVSVEEC